MVAYAATVSSTSSSAGWLTNPAIPILAAVAVGLAAVDQVCFVVTVFNIYIYTYSSFFPETIRDLIVHYSLFIFDGRELFLVLMQFLLSLVCSHVSLNIIF